MIYFERVVTVFVVGFLIWQLLFPVSMGLPVFPIFRRRQKEKHLIEEVESTRHKLTEDDLERELRELTEEHARLQEQLAQTDPQPIKPDQPTEFGDQKEKKDDNDGLRKRKLPARKPKSRKGG
jgi:hypothetical protein